LTLALGAAVIVALLLLSRALEERFTRDLGGVDLVVGAKGSPLQLILSALFQLDAPTGNIPLAEAEALAANRMVRVAVPVSLGDTVRGVRIVGTTPDYPALYGAEIAVGRIWRGPMEVVLGAEAARGLGLGVGDRFAGEHGLAGGEAHAGEPYTVVGVLAPTGAVVDRVVVTDLASVWRVHAHEGGATEREVTAVLIRQRSAMGALMLPRLVAERPDLQAAAPALEMARLTRLLGTGTEVLRGLGAGLLALSALGFFVALTGAVNGRRRELGLLRALGARPALLFALVAGEALLLGLLGGVLGVALGWLAAGIAARAAAEAGGPALSLSSPGWVELGVVLGALALSGLAALIPAAMAYRLDPARALKGA
jgi:putative ABC transport system permease protein